MPCTTVQLFSKQDNNNSLVQRVEEHEGEMIKLQQTLSKLENENEQLNEVFQLFTEKTRTSHFILFNGFKT